MNRARECRRTYAVSLIHLRWAECRACRRPISRAKLFITEVHIRTSGRPALRARLGGNYHFPSQRTQTTFEKKRFLLRIVPRSTPEEGNITTTNIILNIIDSMSDFKRWKYNLIAVNRKGKRHILLGKSSFISMRMLVWHGVGSPRLCSAVYKLSVYHYRVGKTDYVRIEWNAREGSIGVVVRRARLAADMIE